MLLWFAGRFEFNVHGFIAYPDVYKDFQKWITPLKFEQLLWNSQWRFYVSTKINDNLVKNKFIHYATAREYSVGKGVVGYG